MRWRCAVAAGAGALVLAAVGGQAIAAPAAPASVPPGASAPGPAAVRTPGPSYGPAASLRAPIVRSAVAQEAAAARQATVVTATRLHASRRSSAYDTVVTFTASVTAAGATPSGQVLFADASVGGYLAIRSLRGGVASFSTAALAPGVRHVIAVYLGSKTFKASKSAPAGVKVAAAGSDVLGYQVNASHDGYQSRGKLPVAKLTRKWTRTLATLPAGDAPRSGEVSYPLIAGGRVFVTVAHTRSNGTELFALDARTGRTDWETGLGGSFYFSTLAYDGQRVFALNTDGVLTAFSASSGQEAWSVQLLGQWSFSVTMTPYDGMLYTGGSGGGGTVYGISEANGQVLWTDTLFYTGDSSPAVNGTGVYVSYGCQGGDYRFGLDGLPAWHHPGSDCTAGGGGGSVPVLHGGSVYTGDAPLILAQSSGRQAGTYASDTSPAFYGGTMFTVRQGSLVAAAAAGSPVRWSFGKKTLVTAPVVSNGVVFEGSANGVVYGLAASTGRKVWSGKAGSIMYGPDEGSGIVVPGMAIGAGLLVVPAGNQISAFG